LDFGVAKLTKDPVRAAIDKASTEAPTETLLTSPGAAIGTASYMSPEQVRGEDLDGRSDLFSFGIVLYEMATGGSPFRGDTAGVVFDAILNRAPQSLHEQNSDLPIELERIIYRALEKDRNLRYQSAAELRADLKRLRRDTGSAARRRNRTYPAEQAFEQGVDRNNGGVAFVLGSGRHLFCAERALSPKPQWDWNRPEDYVLG
jgi:serine/threonine protein kinase